MSPRPKKHPRQYLKSVSGQTGQMSDFPMKLNCALTLRPLDWSQRVQHLLDFEGRRLSASCEVVSSDLELSGGLSVEKLPAKLQIFEKTQKDLSIFPKYTLGWLSYYPAQDSEHAPFLSGEFALNAQSLEEVWQQVRQGGYTTCVIQIHFGLDRLVRVDGTNWLRDVTKYPHLLIQEATVLFEHQPWISPGPGVSPKA
jgi:hypothetical protein